MGGNVLHRRVGTDEDSEQHTKTGEMRCDVTHERV
jgi:hypothetical protein